MVAGFPGSLSALGFRALLWDAIWGNFGRCWNGFSLGVQGFGGLSGGVNLD